MHAYKHIRIVNVILTKMKQLISQSLDSMSFGLCYCDFFQLFFIAFHFHNFLFFVEFLYFALHHAHFIIPSDWIQVLPL